MFKNSVIFIDMVLKKFLKDDFCKVEDAKLQKIKYKTQNSLSDVYEEYGNFKLQNKKYINAIQIYN